MRPGCRVHLSLILSVLLHLYSSVVWRPKNYLLLLYYTAPWFLPAVVCSRWVPLCYLSITPTPASFLLLICGSRGTVYSSTSRVHRYASSGVLMHIPIFTCACHYGFYCLAPTSFEDFQIEEQAAMEDKTDKPPMDTWARSPE